MKRVVNDTPCYVNQYKDVTDLPETPGNEKNETCNVSCVGMICFLSPDVVLQSLIKTYGIKDKKYQWEEHLIKFLEEDDHVCEPLTKTAWPDARFIKNKELKKMRKAIDEGKVIFYHKYGHYQIMVGYEKLDNGTYNYIFNDPAGDRRIAYRSRTRESGHLVPYPERMVKNEPIYGKCYSVEL